MANLTKSGSNTLVSTTNAAGATTTQANQSLTTSWGAFITGQITNGGTGPTVACTMRIYTSPDGTNYYIARTLSGSILASDVTRFTWEVPDSAQAVGVDFTGNTGQTVTVAAQISYITAIS